MSQTVVSAEVNRSLRELEVSYERSESGLVRSIRFGESAYDSARPCVVDDGDPSADWWLDFLRGNPERPLRKRRAITVVDLFCGSGGLSLGFSLAARALGFSVEHEFAADVDAVALGIYRANHNPRRSSVESVANLVAHQITTRDDRAVFLHPPELLNSDLRHMIGDVEVLLAGPPCQGHSTANNHTRFNDPRNLLYLSVPAIAVALGVGVVIIENVPGVTASREGVVKRTKELLESSGYSTTTAVLRSDVMGWPQTRRRFFLVATKNRVPLPLDEVQRALSTECRPVSWAIQDVLTSSEASIMTETPSMSAENVRRINFLHDNDVYELPNDERPDCHKNGTTYTAVYGRMHWDQPSPTLTTGFMTPGRGRYVHPLERRTLLPREAARIQGFPDSYRFETRDSNNIGRSAIAKGIGDAVPSTLGFAAGLSALLGLD